MISDYFASRADIELSKDMPSHYKNAAAKEHGGVRHIDRCRCIKAPADIDLFALQEEVLIGSAQCHGTHVAREPNRVVCHMCPGRVNIQETLLNGATMKHR